MMAGAAVALVAACGQGSGGTPNGPGTPSAQGGGQLGSAPAAITKPPTPPPAAPKPLTCAQLKNALVGSTTISYNGYHDSIPLADGHWSGEDGATVDLQNPCGIGDLDGDGAKDAVGVVELDAGGTGRFFTLVVWHNNHGSPMCAAVADLGDRNPVESVTISGGNANVVYDTRTPDAPMAEINVRRTAIYHLTGTDFHELSHTDAPI
jgi:hypothetical protein